MKRPFIICIVDDDDIYQYTITKSIKTQQIAKRIMVFSDGEEAIEFLVNNIAHAEELPDVIFLDVNMPIMDGWEFLEEYVKIKPNLKKKIVIYLVTSSVDPVDIDRAKKINEISDYIIKPIQPNQLHSIIEKLEREAT